ncbi:39S ribosomal protein L46, mitochondrial isoform X2 [Betta splendens]|uniref:Large ribosomal subunit protein mL46 n=1 Tax=Betta splendens TaxID=158456 RepID=A0A6P7M3B3_BETSP|nr:39S ribosomal protein L46, mitochondrial isoform X2 [Betta splendens]
MAAPCRRMASRPLSLFVSCLSRTTVRETGLRLFRSTPVCRATPQSKAVTESSPWTLMAAACLQRLPVISADLNPIEQQFAHLMQQMELEKSMLSDHEQRLLEDSERLSRKQAEDYDSDEDGDHRGEEIMLAQDLEDSWEQKLKSFQPAPRVRADVDEDVTSVERCLADPLVLLAQQQVGSEKMWLLPQTRWQEGETLRETAERALTSLPAGFKATFLGSAPCGVYKYKLPKAARTADSLGIKVFFFKAILSGGAPPADASSPFVWVKKSELQRYLKPAYTMKLERFIL